jgi:hypothetical protein
MKPGDPIQDVWQAREELLAEHGGDFDAYFDWLMREQEKGGARVVRPSPPPPAATEPTTAQREEPPPYGQDSGGKK